MNPSLKLFIIVALIVFIPLLIAHKMGYFGKNGEFRPSKTVGLQFREGQVPKQYRYYALSDSAKGTFAIAGIEPGYTIDSPGWNPFTPDPQTLERLTLAMVMQNAYTAQGYQIADPGKKTVGVLYSSLPGPVVRFKTRRIKIVLDIPQHIRQDR